MKRILKVFLLLFGVMIHSQNTLSVKDGAYGYNTDFKLDIHLATDTAIKALQFDLKYDGNNFDYKSTFDLTKSLSLDGDTAPYIQYTHARASRILEKSERSPSIDVDFSLLSEKTELDLVKTIGLFGISVKDFVVIVVMI